MCETYFLVIIPQKDLLGILITGRDCGAVAALGSQALTGE